MAESTTAEQPQTNVFKTTYKEITQPFIDLIRAPRALWGVNLAYTIEGLSYFGILTYLTIYFSDFVFQGVAHADSWSHEMVGVLTAGIAITMVVLGFVPDKIGVRRALILSFSFLLIGRVIISSSPTIWGLQPNGVWSLLHIATMAGIILVTIGYGMYQPAAYAAVRQFTTPKTASMGYAMLYALMNLGSSLTMLGFLVRDEKYLGLGIAGTFWIYTGLTLVSLMATILLLSKKTVAHAIEAARAQQQDAKQIDSSRSGNAKVAPEQDQSTYRIPVTAWIGFVIIFLAIFFGLPFPFGPIAGAVILLVSATFPFLPRRLRFPIIRWAATHPLADARFFFFIFALMPVQTLFTYNWLVLPQYISRAFEGWIGEYYEIGSNVNPILIFILVPIITALTYKKNVYTMMILGTFIMGSSAFILALGPTPSTLAGYILFMTIGEAIWSARFLQYATEIAPEGRAGQYQGVAQLPWFLTKFLVPLLYSGKMIEHYCPAVGSKDTGTMWLIFGAIAVCTPLLLILSRSWMLKGFKTKQMA